MVSLLSAFEVLICHTFNRGTHSSSAHFVSVETKKGLSSIMSLSLLTRNQRKLQSNFACGKLVA